MFFRELNVVVGNNITTTDIGNEGAKLSLAKAGAPQWKTPKKDRVVNLVSLGSLCGLVGIALICGRGHADV